MKRRLHMKNALFGFNNMPELSSIFAQQRSFSLSGLTLLCLSGFSQWLVSENALFGAIFAEQLSL